MNSLTLNDLMTPVTRRFGVTWGRYHVDGAGEDGALEHTVARGHLEVFPLHPGLTLTLGNLSTLTEVRGEAQYPAGVMLAAMIDGTPDMARVDQRLGPAPGCCLVVAADRAFSLGGRTMKGFQGRLAILHASVDWLSGADLPLASLPAGSPGLGSHPLSAAMREALRTLMNNAGPSDGLRALRAESLALGLLADSLGTAHQQTASALRPRDLDAVWAARQAMEMDPFAGHSLASLARLAGISASSLKAKFPRAFGIPVLGFLRDLRLEIAHASLESGRWTVAEAAYAVGYAHSSNFSIAFKRKYGYPPRQVGRASETEGRPDGLLATAP
ncbi:helix-turn-helix transcriptional regulator [Roseospirillum parvum]|uniref:AraC-type DNA-binding protein n=1 Tax=Roseospirillum parvum TaxID=83401 RepID=A0A1G8C3X2_9PROT|nr:AraC family transcriptional regulator [Roseospirillum parvum]SDH40207.1 AraC-type DNA-binding protein [Roseospirillum parvum]